MFVQISQRRVLEMDRGPGLPLGAPRLHLVGSLLSSRATSISTAAATTAATTGFTLDADPGPSHHFRMAQPARCPHGH